MGNTGISRFSASRKGIADLNGAVIVEPDDVPSGRPPWQLARLLGRLPRLTL